MASVRHGQPPIHRPAQIPARPKIPNKIRRHANLHVLLIMPSVLFKQPPHNLKLPIDPMAAPRIMARVGLHHPLRQVPALRRAAAPLRIEPDFRKQAAAGPDFAAAGRVLCKRTGGEV